MSGPITRSLAVLRVRDPAPEHVEALSNAFGQPWPERPCTTTEGAATVLWLAPGEWAVVGLDPAETTRRAGEALGKILHHTADVSAGRVVFAVEGPDARALLARGCALDLHPRAFAPDACAQTRFAQVHALLHRPGDGSRFELWFDASLADWLERWFNAAVGRLQPASARPSR